MVYGNRNESFISDFEDSLVRLSSGARCRNPSPMGADFEGIFRA